MATELTWQTDANRVNPYATSGSYTYCKYQLWYMAKVLTGEIGGFTQGLWTVHSSSTGYLGGAGPGDLWGSTFDPDKITNINPNPSNNGKPAIAHSWITLKSPAGLVSGSDSLYFTIDYTTFPYFYFSEEYKHLARFMFSTIPPTGGDISYAPFWGGSPYSWNYNDQVFNALVSNKTQRLSACLSSRGDFMLFYSFDTFGKFYSTISTFKLTGTQPSDNFPVVSIVNDWRQTASSGSTGFEAKLLSKTSGVYPTVVSRTYNGTAAPPTSILVPSVWNDSANTWQGAIHESGAFAYDKNYSDNSYNEFPAYVMQKNPYTEMKGRIPDVYLAPGAITNGSTRPSTFPSEYVKHGDFWVPWTAMSGPIF